MRRVLADLLAQRRTREVIERHGVRAPVLVSAAQNPGVASIQNHLLPLQLLDVALAQSRRYREDGHVREMRRQLLKQSLKLPWGEGADPAFGLPKELDLRDAIDPLQVVAGAPQDRPDQRQLAARRRPAGDLLSLEFDAVDQRSIDLIELLALQIVVERSLSAGTPRQYSIRGRTQKPRSWVVPTSILA